MMTDSINKGFTMLELMITLSIAAILAATAVPSFQSLMAQSQLTTQTNELVASLHYARSEAVKRGMRVTVCTSSDGSACTNGSGWQNGWIIFSDAGTAGEIDGGDEVLRVFPPLQGVALTASLNFSNSISYLASGRSRGNGNLLGNGSFTLCSQDKQNEISIITAGRPSLRKGQTC